MSGHSKWSTIKHKKGAKDAKRGALFTKLAKNIAIAAREGGGDPDMNFSLRLAIEKAKEANMPKDNVERAIKRGTGELGGEEIVRVSYEAYGPSGVAMIIDCTTDNTNRTVPEIKKIIESNGGKLADPGSVAWQFEEKGLVVCGAQRLIESEKFGQEPKYVELDPEEVVLDLMEVDGVEDVIREGDKIEVIGQKTDLQNIYNQISKMNLKIDSSELIKVPNDIIEVLDEVRTKVEGMVENLEDHDDVESVWANI